MIRNKIRFAFATVVCLFITSVATAGAWPTFRHDAYRGGRTTEQLDTRALAHAWAHRSPHPPKPAWFGPAKWDAYASLRGLRSMRNYDPVFHVIAADGRVYFGSSVDDSVHCLDAATGRELWVYTTDAPVRVAPTLVDGNLYFGSDDGNAYCIRASDATLVWKYSPSPNEPLILHNGRLISKWPVRTGVLVGEGTAYFAASLLPWKRSFLCAVDARTGEPQGAGRYVQTFASDLTFEGPLLASDKLLLCPQGRIPPLLFQRQTGKKIGALHKDGGGGSFVLMTDDERIYHGPGNKGGWITTSNASDRAKLATLPNANALVVAGDRAYVLTDLSLSAIDRKTQKPLWTIPATHPFELIVAGNTIFAGGDRELAAYDAANGERIWTTPIDGRAYGLAVADGSLFVSTNQGTVHCFRADVTSPAPMDWVAGTSGVDVSKTSLVEGPRETESPIDSGATSPPNPSPDDVKKGAVKDVKELGLRSRWVFGRSTATPRPGLPPDVVNLSGGTVRDLVGGRDATILGDTRIVRAGEVDAIALDGTSNSALVTGDLAKADLPTEQLTVAAWVRIDETIPWGGILGAFQDNGEVERGWVLCYRNRRFGFAVTSEDGPGRMTYLTAPADFELGRWYHVAGGYDGKTMRLYVDGKQVAESASQKGPIHYPDQAFVEIGAYHDQDEYFRLHGLIHEVRLYDRALPEKAIARQHEAIRQRFPRMLELADGPVLQFISPTQATVRWWTDFETPTQLALQDDGGVRAYGSQSGATEHQVTIDVPRRDTVYRYQIEAIRDNQPAVTAEFECDTFFNYATRQISTGGSTSPGNAVAGLPVQDGVCVFLGARDIQIPLDLVLNSRMRVIVFDTDQEKVDAARKKLFEASAYGARVSVHHTDSFTDLPVVRGIANLVIVRRRMANANREKIEQCVQDLLIPGRGVGFLRTGRREMESPLDLSGPNWHRIVHNLRPGVGEWSHQYGKADNSAFGGETLGEATGIGDLEIRWLGRPGPRAQADRNGRKPSPLATGGRLFTQGLQRLLSLDAHNGTVLWSLEIPTIGRFNIPRDSSNWCADESSLYVATGGKAWQIDAETGEITVRHSIPDGPNDETKYQWGYIGRHGGLLLGSNVKSDAPFTSFWGKDSWYDAESGPATFKVCSDNLFAIGLSGRHVWNHTDGVIVNSTISVADGKIFYVTCRNPKITGSRIRRIGSPDLWSDLFLVAIDAETGNRIWEQPLGDIRRGSIVLYLAHGSDSLALVSSTNAKYGIYVFNPADGTRRWQAELGWAAEGKADHGSHLQRPAIVEDRLYVRPGVFDMVTGEKQDISISWGKCGTYACTTHAMFFRYTNLSMWSAVDGTLSSWNRTRPGCWLSTIPANGLLLSPEGGGGCSCGNWLETSIVFAPKDK